MLKFINSKLNARKITLQYEKPEDAPFQNQADTVLVEVTNPFSTKESGVTVFKNQVDPDHPEYFTTPTAGQIGNGKVFDLDSYKLGITESDQGYLTFRDGVIDINAWIGAFVNPFEGNEGEPFVIGEGFIGILENYDGFIVDNIGYRFLKDRSTNGGTVLFLDKPLHRDIDNAVVSLVDNLKLYNDFRTKQAICKIATILTEKSYYRPGLDERQRACLKLLTNKQASSILFEQKSYLESNRLLVENVQIIGWLGL